MIAFGSRTRTRRAVLVLALVGGLVGCSSAGELRDASGVPEFTGPHKDFFHDMWLETDLDFVHEMMSDEAISDFEWAEVKNAFEGCISDNGMTVEEFDDSDGGFTVEYNSVDHDTGDRKIEQCKTDSGLMQIGYLRHELITNPTNEDPDVLIAACLVRAEVVEPGYSKEEYVQDMENSDGERFAIDYSVDETTGNAAVVTCNADPTNSFQ